MGRNARQRPPGSVTSRRYPIGAELMADGAVHFRVWAPASRQAAIRVFTSSSVTVDVPLNSEADGYHSGVIADATAETRYQVALDGGTFPDPASRFQPEGPHGPSQVVDPQFHWTDEMWFGRPAKEWVFYELHLGTFTEEGTWAGAEAQLPELARFGITVVEIMPIADFPGRFGWGYDGVNLFAPCRLYGSPHAARSFVNRAHQLGIAVVLDVVYNHLGPDGNYLRQFSPDYFSSKYANEWGDPLNFDGPHAGPVREFFLTNVRYWIEEFHIDGLRLDATQQIFDASSPHILSDIRRVAREAGGQRRIILVGENETQHARLTRAPEAGGYGLDALWNDDFHHAASVAATGRAEAYYSGYTGRAQEFVSCAKHGFLYQGQWLQWQRARRGQPAYDLRPENFVLYLQNHDQIANSIRGARLHQLTAPGQLRALTALVLLLPGIPLLFQGQEFGASAPFLYFADHQPELAEKVRAGRAGFLKQFPSIATAEAAGELADPAAEETFRRCKLDFGERARHPGVYRLHSDLLRLRRDDRSILDARRLDGAVLAEHAFVLRYFSNGTDDRLLLVNLRADVQLRPCAEPLLAPIESGGWTMAWSSESPAYGGGGTPPIETRSGWMIPGQSAVLLKPNHDPQLADAKLSEKD